MLCIPLLHRDDLSKNIFQRCVSWIFQNQTGSNVVGFALIAPLLIYVTIFAMQITALGLNKVTLNTAVHSMSRDYAVLGGKASHSSSIGFRLINTHGLPDCGHSVQFKKFRNGVLHFVEVTVTQCVHVSALNINVTLKSSSRSIDDSYL